MILVSDKFILKFTISEKGMISSDIFLYRKLKKFLIQELLRLNQKKPQKGQEQLKK